MNLPGLDLGAVQAASLRSTNRQLTRFVLETLGGSLARFHTRPEDVPLLVADAGALVSNSGYTCGREYSLLVLSHFLLGLSWWNDPASKSVWSITQAPGLTQDERLDMLTVHAVAHRSQWEGQLTLMHDVTRQMLRLPDDDCDHDRQWRSLEQLMTLRGIPADAQQACYCCYESDASSRYALPAINHMALNENEIRAYRYYGKRLPQPSDDLYKLPPLSRNQVLLHVFLAIAFGRHFYLNPLFTPWVKLLEATDSPRERCRVLASQLAAHQQGLKGPSPHG
ncbi:MAG: hypothetical protein ACN6PW_07985 [Pseudomonas kermanshahensis]|jgi:hypothetical protein|uniref:hypothetical protein n=1 Tax=Pseudomonas kermanshahensis TaxID=2745482 RepID=UPI003D143313